MDCAILLFVSEQKGDREPMERDCGAWINILSHKVKRRLDGTLVNLGVNALQSRVLHYIRVHYRDGPVFQRDVESVFSLSRSTATGVLQHLEREGFISRESVEEDGRLKSLVPTEKAAELDEQVRASLMAIETKMTQGISPGQLQIFMETASKMSSNLDE